MKLTSTFKGVLALLALGLRGACGGAVDRFPERADRRARTSDPRTRGPDPRRSRTLGVRGAAAPHIRIYEPQFRDADGDLSVTASSLRVDLGFGGLLTGRLELARAVLADAVFA